MGRLVNLLRGSFPLVAFSSMLLCAVETSFGQGANKVTPENLPTTQSEIERRKTREQLNRLNSEIGKAVGNFDRDLLRFRESQKTIVGPDGRKRLRNYSTMEEALAADLAYQQYVQRQIAHYNLISKKEDIVRLQRKLGDRNASNNWILYQEKVDARVTELHAKIRGEKSSNKKQGSTLARAERIDSLENEVAHLNALLKGSGKARDNGMGSIDDFLARDTQPSNGGDFLARKTRDSDGGDFLGRESSSDFLSDSTEGGDFLIEAKNDGSDEEERRNYSIQWKVMGRKQKYGVIATSGEVLIPFEYDYIYEYNTRGVAKVSLAIDTYGVDGWDNPGERQWYDHYIGAAIVVSKVGFIDKSGDFIEYWYSVSSPSFKAYDELTLYRVKPGERVDYDRLYQKKKEQKLRYEKAYLSQAVPLYNRLVSKYENR